MARGFALVPNLGTRINGFKGAFDHSKGAWLVRRNLGAWAGLAWGKLWQFCAKGDRIGVRLSKAIKVTDRIPVSRSFHSIPMARYNDGTRYNSGAVYGEVDAVSKPMAKIKVNVSSLPVPQKLIRGTEFINMGTSNPNVPGNAALITALTTAQTALQEAEEAAEEARNTAKQKTADRNAARTAWLTAVTNLAGFTQSATGGNAGKILSAGFEVANPSVPLPVPELVAVTGVTVAINGTPGHSRISWNSVPGADGYLVQGSADPITPVSWQMPQIAMKLAAETNGATAGQKYWYRVAAFNGAGQGPWSPVTERPVM